jgi:hypothetical protein
MPLIFFAIAIIAGSLILGNPGRKLIRRRWKASRRKIAKPDPSKAPGDDPVAGG